MPVDSRDKRASVLGFGLAALLFLPAPGAIDQPDRQHVAYSYRGLAASSPVPAEAADGEIIYVLANDRTIAVSAVDSTIAVSDDDRTVLCPVRPTP